MCQFAVSHKLYSRFYPIFEKRMFAVVLTGYLQNQKGETAVYCLPDNIMELTDRNRSCLAI